MLKAFDEDTIVAISTPPGEGGIGIVRLSGPEAIAVADRIFESTRKLAVRDQKSFSVQHGHIFSRTGSGQKERVDEALLLLMRAPKSYTCEDVVEISAHGGSAVLKAILDLAIQEGARPAVRGEFTKRAFLNGRIDLLQAEAVLDLIKAKTELGRRWASAQLDGVLSEKMKTVKDTLLDLLVHLEASIDFPEDLIDTESLAGVRKKLEELERNVEVLLSKAVLGFILKNGYRVVITGRPNVGKSSLMNCLTRTNRVIVTPFSGTTRDTVEDEIQIRGFPIRIVDTAGIQASDHPIEKAGIERSKSAVAAADLVLYVIDGSQPWSREDQVLLGDLREKRTILVVNKSDLPQRFDPKAPVLSPMNVLCVPTSCVQENGVTMLEEEIFHLISQGQIEVSDDAVINSSRQKALLEKSLQNIKDAKNACSTHPSPELVAVDIRLALDYLGAMVGEVVTDDILESLFNQFCIGK